MKSGRTQNARRRASAYLGLALALAAFAASCSQSSGGNNMVPSFGKGVVTAKGSIFVNGIEYDTSAAKITVNDSSGADVDLKVGMLVEVKGSADQATGKGSATEVLYSAEVDGSVGSITPPSSFTVFGRKIDVDATTVWDGLADITALVVGDRVEVSGSIDAMSGSIKADRVYKKNGSAEDYETKGLVSALSGTSFTLTPPDGAAPFTVSFTGTLDPAIANGSKVEVKFASGGLAGSTITTTAAKIHLESRLSPDDKSEAEVGGVVSGFTAGATATFVVDGVTVSADSSLLPASFGNGVQAEVKGSMNAGTLVATSVKSEVEANAELAGSVTAVSTALGTLTVNGVAISVDATTRFRDENDSGGKIPVEHFGLASIQVGDSIEASGAYSASPSPSFAGMKVERVAPLANAKLAGPVSAATATSLTIMGVAVDTSAATFKDASGNAVASGSAFAALLTLNTTIVKVKGSFSAGSFTATQAGIED